MNEDKLRNGEPCQHPGCLAHQSHPCEGCGRIGGVTQDKLREEFEKENPLPDDIGWCVDMYISSINTNFRQRAGNAYDTLYRQFTAGAESQQPKIETLTARVAVAEGKAAELQGENKKLQKALEEKTELLKGANLVMDQLEKMFPDWKSYHDIVDCISVKLSRSK